MAALTAALVMVSSWAGSRVCPCVMPHAGDAGLEERTTLTVFLRRLGYF